MLLLMIHSINSDSGSLQYVCALRTRQPSRLACLGLVFLSRNKYVTRIIQIDSLSLSLSFFAFPPLFLCMCGKYVQCGNFEKCQTPKNWWEIRRRLDKLGSA